MAPTLETFVRNVLDLFDGCAAPALENEYDPRQVWGGGVRRAYGGKIPAIKYVRATYNLGLKDAKELVDGIVGARDVVGKPDSIKIAYMNRQRLAQAGITKPEPEPVTAVPVPDPGTKPAYNTTLREWYAGMAMQGLIANGGSGFNVRELANHAFQFADAMIKEGESK